MGVNGKMSHCTMFNLFFIISCSFPFLAYSQCSKAPILFNFGDSISDTGRASVITHQMKPLPYGETFFGKPTGRESDGRVVLDFLCESLNTGYLNPYDETLSSNFSNGVNFAISGSAIFSDYALPMYRTRTLSIQIQDFFNFRNLSIQKVSKGRKDLVSEESFKNALYIIDIGLNDLAFSLSSEHLTVPLVFARTHILVDGIKENIMTLYKNGARNIWIHGTSPMGCFPQQLNEFGKGSVLDKAGCIEQRNKIALTYNEKLRILAKNLTSELKDATVVFVDTYTLRYEVTEHAAEYGFENGLEACCGAGEYHGDKFKQCGKDKTVEPCNNVSKRLYWDFVHYTDAASKVFASKILSGNYTEPPTKINFFCNTQ